jgi:membrane-associated phospholipid phosphatase
VVDRQPSASVALSHEGTSRVRGLYDAALLAVWVFGVRGARPIVFPAVHVALLAVDAARRRYQWPLPLAPRARILVSSAVALVLLAFYWGELGALHRCWPRATHDALVARWDLALFGAHLNETWRAALPAPWLRETMHALYASYYLLAFLPVVVAGLARSEEEAADTAFRLLATYLPFFLFYVAFPVLGPATGTLPAGSGWFSHLTTGLRASGDSPGTAFPSSHVGGSVAMAVGVWGWWGRRWGLFWAAGALLVAVATVHTGNHFAIDAVFGAACGVCLQWPRLRARLCPAVPVGTSPVADPAPLRDVAGKAGSGSAR